MNKSNFDAMTSTLDKRIAVCSDNFGTITSDTDIQNLTIAEARRLRDLAKTETEKMTTIAMCDLYHVIGMGNLSAVQLSELMKRLKKYLSYRPVIKAFANSLGSIDELPTIKPDTVYRLQELGNFYLVNGEDGEEEVASLSEYRMRGKYEEAKHSELDFTLEGDTIKLPENQIDNFIKYGNLIGMPTTLEVSKLIGKIQRQSKYCGISWKGFDSDGNAIGIIENKDILANMKKYTQMREEIKAGRVI